ncbi:MAG: TrkH family potassium uptake protein [Bacteroidetes bacterium]|nr:TrkH family potassium uptake protein [Rhodothermia bacterium]MCS7155428.1 TrkH family potassium uptake protein [Bacteroidota bacterium]MCX7907479.1 TrkH family potassium uptake protein [Bacteroidota bacterium]MDW8138473.1 TrkH family potassium uptake protein [Bacteroidota bacterium]MDW8284590.1 TrkH family potassium uptake protein [Bacteroidota bacterium]
MRLSWTPPFSLPAVGFALGVVLTAVGATQLLPLALAFGFRELEPARAFALSSSLSMAAGVGLAWSLRRHAQDLRLREGFLVVTGGWIVATASGLLPFTLSRSLGLVDALFETASGFTTTGASVLGGPGRPRVEELPQSLLFWRSLTQWLGGMGIIVLSLAILPVLGVGGMQLYKAEVPGPTPDKLTPRIRDTATRLWGIYLVLTAAQTLLLSLHPRVGLLEALQHAFTTMATGGFSTRSASIGAFESAYVEYVTILFMVLAGINFALHYRLLLGRVAAVASDRELWAYGGIALLASGIVFIALLESAPSAEAAWRMALFQVVSILTTTGYATADYEAWPPLAIATLFLLFFVGGMAGSTGGGPKVVRLLILFQNANREIRRLLHPRAVLPVRLGSRVISDEVLQHVLSFFTLYLGLCALSVLLLASTGVDLLTAIGSTITCIGNVGPGFGEVGPAEHFAHLSDGAKLWLSALMLVGRLELFTVLVLFSRSFWKR